MDQDGERPAATPSTLADPADGAIRFIRLETVVGIFVSRLFPGYRVRSQGAFRVLRDSEVEVQEEAEDLVRLFESALKKRRRGSVIRLEIEASMPARLQRFVMKELKVSDRESFVQKGLIGVTDTNQLIAADRPDLKFQPYLSRFPELKLVSITEVFGGWEMAQRVHFADGGIFDKIYQPGK